MDRREELRRTHRESRPLTGVYQIRNKMNGKLLLGSSINLPAILNRFRLELRQGTHRNATLQQDWNRFGGESFDFEILEELDLDDHDRRDVDGYLALMLELWLKKLEPWEERGYHAPPR